jgi:choice-of-anchor A domain-containing protein
MVTYSFSRELGLVATLATGCAGVTSGGVDNTGGTTQARGSDNGGTTWSNAGTTSGGGTQASGGAIISGGLWATGGTGTGNVRATGGLFMTGGMSSSGGTTIVGSTAISGGTAGTGGDFVSEVPTGGATTATGGFSSFIEVTGGGTGIAAATGGGTSVDMPKCLRTDLNNVNAYVIKDVTSPGIGADCEGNMYVGGNMTAGAYPIGVKDGAKDCNQYSLIVGGNVSGVKVYNGSAVAGGTVTNSEDTDCGGVIGRKGTNLPSPPLPAERFPALEAKVEALSTALAQLPVNGTVTTNGSALVLTGTDPKQNVFSVKVEQLGNVVVNVPSTSFVIINVSGTAVNWPSATIALPGGSDSRGDYAFASNVIWNFYEATTFYNTSAGIQGTILAPLATFTGAAGHVAGQVIVKYMTSLSVEFHPYYFSGCITWPTTS